MRSNRLGPSRTVLVLAVLAACSPEPRWIAVAGPDAAAVLVFDAGLGESDTLAVAPVADVHFGPDGTTLYMVRNHPDAAGITRVARATGLVLEQQALPGDMVSGLWILHDGQTLVASGATALHLLPISLSHPGKSVEICDDPIRGFTPTGVRGRAYAVCGEGRLVEIDTDLEIVVRSISHEPCGTEDVAVSPNGTIVYLLCQGTGTLLYFDRLSLTPFDSVSLGIGGREMALTPSGQKAVITRPDAGEVVVVDLRRRAVDFRLRVGAAWDAAIGMDGRFAYVTAQELRGPGRLIRIDLDGATVSFERQTLAGSVEVTLWPGPESPKLSVPTFQTAEPRRRE
jgi:hypothetical protein